MFFPWSNWKRLTILASSPRNHDPSLRVTAFVSVHMNFLWQLYQARLKSCPLTLTFGRNFVLSYRVTLNTRTFSGAQANEYFTSFTLDTLPWPLMLGFLTPATDLFWNQNRFCTPYLHLSLGTSICEGRQFVLFCFVLLCFVLFSKQTLHTIFASLPGHIYL